MEPEYRSISGEYLHLRFRVYRDGHVQTLPSFHLPGTSEPPPSTPATDVALELRAADETVVGFHRCHLSDLHADPNAPFTTFNEMLPWMPETASIVFVRNGAEVHTLEIEADAPDVRAARVEAFDRDRDLVTVAWRAGEDEHEGATYLVRYSNDGGTTWRGLAAGLSEPRLETDLRSLAGGEECIFQIAASAGVRTTVVQTAPMAVEVKPRRAYMLSPEADACFPEGESLVLAGVGFSPDFGTAAFEDVSWSSNVAGFLGYGYEMTTHTLERGVHILRLGVTDGVGGEATVHVRITIEPRR